MRADPLPFIGGFYADESRPWSQQDIVNYLVAATEAGESTRTLLMAKTPPGLSPFVEVPNYEDPIRSVYCAEGRLFTVAGNEFYQISNTGVAIPRGSVSGVSRVRMAHNQITGGNQVMVVNGNAGYIYQTTDQTFAIISDDGFPGAIDVLYMDGYFIIIEPGRRYAQSSDLADGTAWNTLDRFTSEKSPDLLMALGATQNDLILFSETTAEFFENTGAAQQPFRSKRISMERGCASRFGVIHLDNTVFWLGNDGKFYVLDGYGPRRISTRPIEQAIMGLNWGQAFGFKWESAGHAVAYWTFPDGQTWGYDISQPPGFQWHRRESLGFNRWRLTDTAYWQGRWIAGDFQAGWLWEMDWDYPMEYQSEFVSELTGPVIHDNQNAVKMPRLELIFDTGQPEVAEREFSPQPAGPTIEGAAPDGVLGETYGAGEGGYAYTVTPGDAAIVGVTLRSGTLPNGVTLNSAGELSNGPPTVAGPFTFTLRVTDSNGLWDEITDTVEIAVPMFVAIDNLLTLQKSSDRGLTFPDAIASDLTTPVSEVCVGSAGGLLFHFGDATEGRVSDDGGASFAACAGLGSSSGFIPGTGNLLLVGAELQLYHWGLHYAPLNDPDNWTERTISSGVHDAVRRPAARGSLILAYAAANVLNVSQDAGLTFTEYTETDLHATEGVQRLLSIGTSKFVLFGRDSVTGNLKIGYSETGLGGSWTYVAGPATAIVHGVARNPTTGRVLIVLQTGATWFCDNIEDDVPVWEAGAAVPYAGAGTYPPEQANNMVFTNSAFFFGAAQGGGVNRIYRTTDGEAAWTQSFANASGNAIHSLTGYVPS